MRLLILALALLLGGCDYLALQELKPGISTDLDVRDRFGQPTMEWRNSDDSLTWEYPRGPAGTDTYMISIGPDRILRRVEQVLSEANYARIERGMTGDEVRRILGKPGAVTPFPAKGEVVWDWHIAGTLPTEEWHFHVHFGPDGKVSGTSRRQELRR